MKALLALACSIGALVLVVGLGMTSASCGDKDDGPGFGTGGDDDDEVDVDDDDVDTDDVVVPGCEEERTDCPATADLTAAGRDDLLDVDTGGAALLDTVTSSWGWSSGVIDFTCCRVSSATVSGTASASFDLGWVGFGEDFAPGLLEVIASVPAGSFSQEITFTAENEMAGIYISTGAETEEEVEAFGSISIVFEVEPL